MKFPNNLTFLIPIILLITIWESAFAQNQQITWDYPIKPGSKEWLSKSDFIERLNLLNISEDTLSSIETERLVNICLEYPFFGIIYSRNSLQQGYEFIKSNFNGFRVLEGRPDAGEIILKKYDARDPTAVSNKSSNLEIGQYMAEFSFIEILLSQDSILFKLKDETKKKVLAVALGKFNQKVNQQKYGIEGLSTTALIMAKLINYYDDKNHMLNLNEKTMMKEFSKSCNIEDPGLLKLVLRYSENYSQK